MSEQVESCTQTILPATPGWYVATLCKGRGELLRHGVLFVFGGPFIFG
jgi:hypothetical protein